MFSFPLVDISSTGRCCGRSEGRHTGKRKGGKQAKHTGSWTRQGKTQTNTGKAHRLFTLKHPLDLRRGVALAGDGNRQHKHTSTQAHKHTGTQAQKQKRTSIEAQAHKHTSTQAHKHTSKQAQKDKHRSRSTQAQRHTSIQAQSTEAQAQKHSSSGLEKRCGFGRRWEETTQRGHNYFASAPAPAATSNFCKNKRISQNDRHCLQSALNPNAWTRLPL